MLMKLMKSMKNAIMGKLESLINVNVLKEKSIEMDIAEFQDRLHHHLQIYTQPNLKIKS